MWSFHLPSLSLLNRQSFGRRCNWSTFPRHICWASSVTFSIIISSAPLTTLALHGKTIHQNPVFALIHFPGKLPEPAKVYYFIIHTSMHPPIMHTLTAHHHNTGFPNTLAPSLFLGKLQVLPGEANRAKVHSWCHLVRARARECHKSCKSGISFCPTLDSRVWSLVLNPGQTNLGLREIGRVGLTILIPKREWGRRTREIRWN